MRPWLALLGASLAGCAHAPLAPPDPLRATATALSLAGLAITAESRASDAALEADYRGRIAACPAESVPREACKATAREQALDKARPRNNALKDAAALQHRAADLAEAADACRRGGQPCEEAKFREAKAALDDLGGLLSRLQGGSP